MRRSYIAEYTVPLNLAHVNNEKPLLHPLNEGSVEIRMQLMDGPKDFYATDPPRSELIMLLEPGKGIKLNIKTPGSDSNITTTELKFNYENTFPDVFIQLI
ncbi:hypothetical protein GYMLUDRAFT_1016514 [Collybiopsis luxurians FD-317 M1]|uniref:Uncharacterized protein n=1 Tax=Collybiopsis luxurians FD-317 M1 TaxID=944289 RepID=A0A0D0AZW6_9AGAR|nr:hypothetical protein GYMLUDRAFT_1016514 [Collybiopsis luxurians FD-317 M1]